jgi:hypothetical protein
MFLHECLILPICTEAHARTKGVIAGSKSLGHLTIFYTLRRRFIPPQGTTSPNNAQCTVRIMKLLVLQFYCSPRYFCLTSLRNFDLHHLNSYELYNH